MKRKLISVLAALAMTTSLTLPALADTLLADGDGLIPVSNNVLNFDKVTAGSNVSRTVLLAINRTGGSGNRNVFGDDSTVTVDYTNTNTNLTLSIPDNSIKIPVGWNSLTQTTTQSLEGEGLGTSSSTVTLTVPNGTVPGPYSEQIKYTASGYDSNGEPINRPTTVTVNYTVVAPADTTAPTATVKSGPTGYVNIASGDQTFTWSGNDDSSSAGKLTYLWKLNDDRLLGTDVFTSDTSTTIQKSSFNKQGANTFYVWAKDEAGNISAQPGIYNFNVDTIAPTISYTLSPATPNGSNNWYTSGVGVAFTYSDADGSGIDSTTIPENYTLSTDGIYKSNTVNVKDLAGNTGSVTVEEIKIDQTAPTFNLNGFVNGGYYQKGTQLTWSSLDSLSGADPTASGIIDTSTIGQHNVTITAKDLAGNTSDMTISYTVFDFSGILQPINPDYTSVFKQGSTIPVKFQLGDDASLANLTICRIAISSAGTIPSDAQINESVSVAGDANNDNTFRYDSTSKQYIYNLSTKTYAKGAHFRANVLLNGKIIGFTEFGLK